MSEYLLLIHGDEAKMATADQGLFDEMMKGHNDFGHKHAAALRGGNALQGSETATSVRPTGGGFSVTDGPYAETKEALGGYYLVEAANLDEAIAIAKDIPMPHGGVEVRPVRVFD